MLCLFFFAQDDQEAFLSDLHVLRRFRWAFPTKGGLFKHAYVRYESFASREGSGRGDSVYGYLGMGFVEIDERHTQ